MGRGDCDETVAEEAVVTAAPPPLGDGSIGVQVSKPVGTIVIDKGITTHGSVGNTLVKA